MIQFKFPAYPYLHSEGSLTEFNVYLLPIKCAQDYWLCHTFLEGTSIAIKESFFQVNAFKN